MQTLLRVEVHAQVQKATLHMREEIISLRDEKEVLRL
jgi:hypothetical protein